MKHLFFFLFMLVALSGSAQAVTHTCGTTTQAGTPCSRKVDKAGLHCWQHGGQTKAEKSGTTLTNPAAVASECGAPTKTTGAPCKNKVKGGGRCHLHKG